MAFLRAACLALATLPLLASSNSTFLTSGVADFRTPRPDPVCDAGDDALVVMEGFDMQEYSGSWHEVRASGSPRDCSTHVFATASGTVAYFEKDYNAGAGTYRVSQGRVRGAGSARLLIRRPSAAGLEAYSVVNTDYATYSIVRTCPGLTAAPAAVRVLSRDYTLPSRVARAVNAVLLDRFDLSLETLTAADNKGCIPDTCPPVGPTPQDLDLRQLAGWWHQLILFYKDPPQHAMPDCTTWLLSAAPNGSLFLQREYPDRSPRRLLEARPDDPLAADGRFSVRLRLGGGDTWAARFDVLGANYKSWVLVSFCSHTLLGTNINGAVEMYTMLLTRYPLVDSVPWRELRDTLAQHDLQHLHRQITSSMSCPAPRCLDWIPVKTPLDGDKFLGYWFVMEQTATSSDTGFCAKHWLRLDDEGGTLPEAHVRLDIIQYGRAPGPPSVTSLRLRQDDPIEGKFTVMKPAPPDSFENYWVLDTDYVSFAVVYSCSGLREERVWIMSRSPGLSWAAARHVADVLVQSHVDARALRTVDWPAFCAPMPTWPNPDDPDDPDDPDHPASGRAPRTALPSAAVQAIVVLLAVGRAAAAPRAAPRRVGLQRKQANRCKRHSFIYDKYYTYNG